MMDAMAGIGRCCKGLIGLCMLLGLMACALTSESWNSQAYSVRPGETLYSIAWRYRLDHRDIARWNGIPQPYTIYAGQKLFLTGPASSVASAAVKPPRRVKTVSRTPQQAKVKSANKLPPRQEEVTATVSPVKWQWPVKGKLLKRFDASQISSQGLNIAARPGEKIVSAASGKVVYSGEGLIGYGKLLIIKHDEIYLSAYAHNRKILVSEGEQITIGQEIAEMGAPSGGQTQLHFEIRKHGKPVDPMKYLPKP